ncbi:MAG: rhodanese-like domain-containing protein [Chlorobiaceae bacterium]|nr:rhodanese-like domain-containing protein [Chlorobiaceae bacterium]
MLYAVEVPFDHFLRAFDHEQRKDMKVSSRELLTLLKEGKAQLVDTRFRDEYVAWHMGFGSSIPLNDLPDRLIELSPDRIIVTACSHKDRAALAMLYLCTKGYRSRYLEDGFAGLAELLRGDEARALMEHMRQGAK